MNKYVLFTILLVCVVDHAVSRRIARDVDEEDAFLDNFARRELDARELLYGLFDDYLQQRDLHGRSYDPSSSYSGSYFPSSSYSDSYNPSSSYSSYNPSNSYSSYYPSNSYNSYNPSSSYAGSYSSFSSRGELFDEEDFFDMGLRSWPSSSWPTNSWPSNSWASSSWPTNSWPSNSWASSSWPTNSWPSNSWASSSWPSKREHTGTNSRFFRIRRNLNDNQRNFQ